MLCLAVTAFAVLVFLVAASETPENATGISTQFNAALNVWSEAGSYVQLALATAVGQLLPLSGDTQQFSVV
jgi:hypothetical protein